MDVINFGSIVINIHFLFEEVKRIYILHGCNLNINNQILYNIQTNRNEWDNKYLRKLTIFSPIDKVPYSLH